MRVTPTFCQRRLSWGSASRASKKRSRASCMRPWPARPMASSVSVSPSDFRGSADAAARRSTTTVDLFTAAITVDLFAAAMPSRLVAGQHPCSSFKVPSESALMVCL